MSSVNLSYVFQYVGDMSGQKLIDFALDGDLEGVKREIEGGVPVEQRCEGYTKYTALIGAASEGHIHVVKYLVKEAGADVEAVEKHNYTPLIIASQCGQLKVKVFRSMFVYYYDLTDKYAKGHQVLMREGEGQG